MPKRFVRSPYSDEQNVKHARRASPMSIDAKSVSAAKGVEERTSRPYVTKPKSKSSTYHTAKSKSNSYYSMSISPKAHASKQPSPQQASRQAPPTAQASRPAPTAQASRPAPTAQASRPAPPTAQPSRPPLSFSQMLKNYYHTQLLKLKDQFGFSPFKMTLRLLVPFHPDKVFANTSREIIKSPQYNTAVNSLYKDLESARDNMTSFERVWMIYRTHMIRVL